MDLMETLTKQLAILLNANSEAVKVALISNNAMFDGLYNPSVRAQKVDSKYSPPSLMAKCIVSSNQNGHAGLEVKKVALGEDYKILIRTLKVQPQKHCAQNKRAQMIN